MQRKKLRDLAQHLLDLNQQPYEPPVTRDTPGLIDAVVALLLAAAGASEVERPTKIGGADEQ